MTIKTTIAAAFLMLAPGFAFAQFCEHGAVDQQAMSCAEGMVWDETAGSCIEQVNS